MKKAQGFANVYKMPKNTTPDLMFLSLINPKAKLFGRTHAKNWRFFSEMKHAKNILCKTQGFGKNVKLELAESRVCKLS